MSDASYTPREELVWDTGHQAYPHKILTGRRDKFDTIRTYHGLSGYPTPDESPYDTFPVGQAGTSVSVALGLAKARDAKGLDHHVVAVIGDGAMTSGLALEDAPVGPGRIRLRIGLGQVTGRRSPRRASVPTA